MNAVIFDGRKYAAEREAKLVGKGIAKKLVSIFNPDHQPSAVYTRIKARMAERLGVEFIQFPISNFQFPINDQIIKLNNDKTVNGIMIQLPLLPERESRRIEEMELCNLIAPEKDVDGLGANSLYLPAAVKAVMEIFKLVRTKETKICVVGSKGYEGRGIVKALKLFPASSQLTITEMDKENFDPSVLQGMEVIISATGQAGLITPEMVRDGVIAIDVGYPQGDFAPGVAEKAHFLTPVPGGVGPVTVVMLFQNLIGG